MKTSLLQIIYANHFAGLDHENPCTHLTKFYAFSGTPEAPKAKEYGVFMGTISHSII